MFGPVWRSFILMLITLRCFIASTEHPEYSPLKARLVQNVGMLPMPPRVRSSHAHKRFRSSKLYLFVLLLTLSGDIELNPGPMQVMCSRDDQDLKIDQNATENFVLNRTKALQKKLDSLNRPDYLITSHDGMQVTIKLNAALFEVFKNEFGKLIDHKGISVTDQKRSYDRTRLITKFFAKIEFENLKVAMTSYFTTSTILVQSNQKGTDGSGAAMIFTTSHLVPFLDQLTSRFQMPNIRSELKQKLQRLFEDESKLCVVCKLPLTYKKLRKNKTAGVLLCAASMCQNMSHANCTKDRRGDIWLCLSHHTQPKMPSSTQID